MSKHNAAFALPADDRPAMTIADVAGRAAGRDFISGMELELDRMDAIFAPAVVALRLAKAARKMGDVPSLHTALRAICETDINKALILANVCEQRIAREKRREPRRRT